MATTSFTKNFSLPTVKSFEFIGTMTKTQNGSIIPDNFESQYSHPDQYKDELKRVFGK